MQSRRPSLEPWTRFWHRWVTAAFSKSYLEVARRAPILPDSPEDVARLLDAYCLEQALRGLVRQLPDRAGQARAHLISILDLLGDPT